jgi:hypothetical protein
VMTGTNGTCENLVVAGDRLNCSQVKGIVYTHLTNGRTLLTLATPDGGVLSFVGENDSQSIPEEYRLYLSRVELTLSNEEAHPQRVSGVCTVRMSRDGYVWYRIDCDASDANNSRYSLRFKSDGKRIDVQSP